MSFRLHLFVVCSLLVISGCATPSPDMFNGTRHRISRGGIDFVVTTKATEAEVIRLGYLGRGQRGRIPALMAEAAAEASGCKVIPSSMDTKIPGDTGVARFDLDCRGMQLGP